MFTQYIFHFLSILALFSAVMMLASKKPIHSVLFLTLTFFAIAGHYVLLNAQFLAVVHIIVYAGAIMVLFLFTVMLLNLNNDERSPKPMWVKIIAFIAGGMLIPGNIPNIIAASKLKIKSREWARLGVPLGFAVMVIFFVILKME